MIELNEKFGFRFRLQNWELVEKIPKDADHPWTKDPEGYNEFIRYYPTLGMLCVEHLKMAPDGKETLQEILKAYEDAKCEIKEALKQYELLRKSKPVD